MRFDKTGTGKRSTMEKTHTPTVAPVWTLSLRMFASLAGYGTDLHWSRRFSFHANNEAEALSLARQWARYQGFGTSEVSVSPATPDDQLFGISDEFVEAFRP